MAVQLTGSITQQGSDVPTRVGQRVDTEADIAKISTPFRGMIIYIADQDLYVYVKTLKDKKIGSIIVKNALVDEYKVFSGNTESLIWNNVQ